MSFLNETGLRTLWSNIISKLNNKVDKVNGKGLSTNDYTNTYKDKLDSIASGAEVNQNAFSNFLVGSTTISADGKTDTLTLTAGSNITLAPDATNDKITITATDTTYSAATTSTAGLMSAADKTKLNGIATGATKISVDSSMSSSSTNPVQNKVVNSAISAKYTKPSTGIPKSDLASAVQTSLEKADTAIQSLSGYATETYVDNKIIVSSTTPTVTEGKIWLKPIA